MSDRKLEFTLRSEHTQMERALMLARLALAEFANDRHGMTERAAYRIADALEKYGILDNESRFKNMPITNPLANPLIQSQSESPSDTLRTES